MLLIHESAIIETVTRQPCKYRIGHAIVGDFLFEINSVSKRRPLRHHVKLSLFDHKMVITTYVIVTPSEVFAVAASFWKIVNKTNFNTEGCLIIIRLNVILLHCC